MSDIVDTVKVVATDPEAGAFVVINRDDFDPEAHTLFEGEDDLPEEERVEEPRDEVVARIQTAVRYKLDEADDEALRDLLSGVERGVVVIFGGADDDRVSVLTQQLDQASARLTALTDRELDLGRFILATFDLHGFPEGEQVTEAAIRLLGEQRTEIADMVAKLQVSEASLASALSQQGGPTSGEHQDEFLLGSSVLPAHVDLGNGIVIQLGGLVCASQVESGLSVADWNGLSEEDREAKLEATRARFAGDPAAARAEIQEGAFISGFADETGDGDGKKAKAKKADTSSNT